MTKRKIFTILGVCLIISFFVFSFRLIRSQTGLDSAVAAYRPKDAQGALNLNPTKTGLYVAGDTGLERAVAQKLRQAISGRLNFGEIEWVGSEIEKYEAPLLTVELTQHKVLWTPVMGRAEVAAEAAYATHGDVSFRNTQPVHFTSQEGPAVLQMMGTYTLADASWGIMSRMGYDDYLADRIVQRIVESIETEIAK